MSITFTSITNMRVTSKGQVTIPKRIRDKMGIRAGSEVRFVQGEDGRVYLSRVDDLERQLAAVRSVAGSISPGWTTERIMKLTRGADWEGEPGDRPVDREKLRRLLEDHSRRSDDSD